MLKKIIIILLSVSYMYPSQFDLNMIKASKTPLYECCSRNRLDILAELIKEGSDITKKNCMGQTFLHNTTHTTFPLAQLFEEQPVAKTLINIPDNQGDTPIFSSIRYYNLDKVKIFVENGASLEHKNNRGQTPLMHAIFRENQLVSDNSKAVEAIAGIRNIVAYLKVTKIALGCTAEEVQKKIDEELAREKKEEEEKKQSPVLSLTTEFAFSDKTTEEVQKEIDQELAREKKQYSHLCLTPEFAFSNKTAEEVQKEINQELAREKKEKKEKQHSVLSLAMEFAFSNKNGNRASQF